MTRSSRWCLIRLEPSHMVPRRLSKSRSLWKGTRCLVHDCWPSWVQLKTTVNTLWEQLSPNIANRLVYLTFNPHMASNKSLSQITSPPFYLRWHPLLSVCRSLAQRLWAHAQTFRQCPAVASDVRSATQRPCWERGTATVRITTSATMYSCRSVTLGCPPAPIHSSWTHSH